MEAFQGKIRLTKGVISYLERGIGYSEIETNNLTYKFKDCFVYPGFVDSHGHIASLGTKLNALQLNDCLSKEDCVQKALKHQELRGNWLLGYGWNNENWFNKSFPDKKELDFYFKDIPVCFYRVDGHSIWVNSKAMEIAGINNRKCDIKGGDIIRYKDGSPTGVLIDNAIEIVTKHIPKLSKEKISKYILNAISELNKNGLTEIHDMDLNPDLINIYKELSEAEKLNIRIFSFVKAQDDEYIKYKIKPYCSDFFSIVGIKLYVDGALGSRGAALLAPYSDEPRNKGLLLLKEKELYEKIDKAIGHDLQVAVHAIGDRANRTVLKTFNKILEKHYEKHNLYFRIEHAQIIHPDDFCYLSDGRIICSVQPIHCISDSEMAIKRLGQRCKYAYLWKSLLNQNINILGGSDFPIESHNPILGIDAFVNRIENNTIKQWFSEETINISQALNAYISNPRGLGYSNIKRGKLKEGNYGDFIVLNKELKSKTEIKKIKVIATFVNGKNVFIDKSFISY